MTVTTLLVCLAWAGAPEQEDEIVFRAPHFVVERSERVDMLAHRLLYNGTLFGRNFLKPPRTADHGDPKLDFSRLPTAYYHDKSPIGIALQRYNWFGGADNTYHADARLPASLVGLGRDPLGQLIQLWSEPPIAVLGMGIATLASYARPGQTIHFMERQPILVKLSLPDGKRKPYFHFAQDALNRGVHLKVFQGEPRTMIEKHGGAKHYQLLIVETCKLPVSEVEKELMTREAVALLMGKVREDGMVCYHVSNRYFDLVPTVASAGRDLNFACVVGNDDPENYDTEGENHGTNSTWVMVAREEKHLKYLKAPPGYDKLKKRDILGPYWSPPERIGKRFIWADKGENSFRGIYIVDPRIARLAEKIGDLEDYILDSTGISDESINFVARLLRASLRRWSRWSAEIMNRDVSATDEGASKSQGRLGSVGQGRQRPGGQRSKASD